LPLTQFAPFARIAIVASQTRAATVGHEYSRGRLQTSFFTGQSRRI
jgi:hypothetical protein